MSTFTEGSATARVVADSIYRESRLVSIEVKFPRSFLAEFDTHCRLGRNAASSRAIPVRNRLHDAYVNPFIPDSFGTNKAGMQAGDALSKEDQEKAVSNWLFGRDVALVQAYYLAGGRKEILAGIKGQDNLTVAHHLCGKIEDLAREYGIENRMFSQDRGLHKQHVSRVLEPYLLSTVIATATHWRNFFGLRASTKAQPEAQDFAIAMARAMRASTPKKLSRGEWHLPYIREDDEVWKLKPEEVARASAGRCARVSYLTQDGRRSFEEDLKLADTLQKDGHMSPFQHVARPREKGDPKGSHGNLSLVWTQLRKLMRDEHDFVRLTTRDSLVEGCRGDEELADFICSLNE